MIDVAVVGCGHMGRHHARIVAAHPECRLVAAVDLVDERAAEVAARWGAEARRDVPDVDAIVIATPASTHAALAGPLLARGCWVLVEKPLAATAVDAFELASPRLGVGHVERFNPAIRAAGELRPRYIEARRLSPPSPRGRDVDVVLDLMVHDLDLVLSWTGGAVAWFDAVGVAVDGPLIDTASVRLRTTCGVTASLVASRVAGAPERTLRVFEQGRATTLDLQAGVAFRDGPLAPAGGDALTAQWAAFVGAILGEGALPVGFSDGRRVVALAERISAAIASGL